MFDSLEARKLLSSSLAGGVLTITGTGSHDNFALTLVSGKIVVNEHVGANKSYLASSVTIIKANMSGGDDVLTIDDAITKPTSLLGGSGNDSIKGGGGKDSIFGSTGNDTLNGSNGDDQLNGEDNDDHLLGGAGKDAMFGGTGNDVMDGGTGNDFFSGGTGNDTVDYSSRTTPVIADITTDYANKPGQAAGGGGGSGEKDTYLGCETLKGGSGKDGLSYVAASEPANKNFTYPFLIDGGSNNDSLSAEGPGYGGGPNDFKYSIVSLNGGDGNDTILYHGDVSTKISGGNGNDVMENEFDEYATLPISVIGGPGTDLWGPSNDYAGSYTVTMDPTLENLIGEDTDNANVTIQGNDLANKITWGGGKKITIFAKGGNDIITLEENDDGVGSGATEVHGGDGNDTMSVLYNGGSFGKNTLLGEAGNDTLHGGMGDDSLVGGTGNDKLYGGNGNDVLIANDGAKDTLDGGMGNDKAKRDAIDSVVNVETFI